MNRNTTISTIAILALVAAVGLSASLIKPINAQRSDLRLVYNPDVTANLPPKMALLRTFLGSFKSIVANVMWMRAETLKQDGKHHEAMELAQIISDLQPRFPEVWSFLSWNMAYNISVATHTPRERWMWVNRGIELLRDKGIPANPTSTKLYRQLGWTFLHKVGQFSDDMHWYYKQELATHWQLLLGAPERVLQPRLGEDGKPLVDQDGNVIYEAGEIAGFRAIAAMDDRFFADDALDRRIREKLKELEKSYPSYADRFRKLRYADPYSFDRRAARVIDTVESRFTDVLEAFADMRSINAHRLALAKREPRALLLEAYPQTQSVLAMLDEHGYELNERLLLDTGRTRWRLEAGALGYPVVEPPADQAAKYQALEQWIGATDEATVKLRDEVIFPFVRAKVLRDTYHMSPTFMMELMEGLWLAEAINAKPIPIPLDWRHPAAHGLYWSALGVLMGQERRDSDQQYRFTMLNTDRQVIHSLQAMTHNGSIAFDPFARHYDQLPDPRFIEGYLAAVDSAMSRIDPDDTKPGVPRSFHAGRENYMIWAVRLFYVWGSVDKANAMYQRLGIEYGHTQADRFARYTQPLEKFIQHDINEDIKSLNDARKIIGGLIVRVITESYVNGRADIAKQQLELARKAYKYYQDNQKRFTPNATRDRMGLKPFGQLVADVLADFMTRPHGPRPQGVPIPMKELVWRNIPDYLAEDQPNELKQRVWDRIRRPLYAQVDWYNDRQRRAAGNRSTFKPVDAAKLFPEPPDMTAYRKKHGLPEPQALPDRPGG